MLFIYLDAVLVSANGPVSLIVVISVSVAAH